MILWMYNQLLQQKFEKNKDEYIIMSLSNAVLFSY